MIEEKNKVQINDQNGNGTKPLLQAVFLAPYLPYEIEVLNPFNERNKIIGIKNETYFIEKGNTYAYGDIRDCRLILKPISDLLTTVYYEIEYKTSSTYLEYFSKLCDMPFYESGYFSDTITKESENGVYSIFDRNNRNQADFSYLKFDSHKNSFLVYHKEKEINIPYKMYELLFEHHFDLFGLIPAGLAVSIHKVARSRYFYKDGSEVMEGDICFYSEYDGINNHFHYADGIYTMEIRDNDIFPRASVITMTEAKSFEDYNEPISNTVSLKYGSTNGVVNNFVKIGRIETNSEMLTKEYAMEHYAVL